MARRHDTRIDAQTVAWILLAATLPFAAPSRAQTFPSKTIRIVVPYPPGGGVDITGRAIAQQLSAAFGLAVIVDNRPGAGGTVGTDLVAKSAADGYTLLVGGRGPLARGTRSSRPPAPRAKSSPASMPKPCAHWPSQR